MKRVITYGTYDMLHYGHLNLLRRDGYMNQMTDLDGYFANTSYVIGQQIVHNDGEVIGYAVVSKDATTVVGACLILLLRQRAGSPA